MPGSVDYCRTTPSLCTNGDFDLLQRHPYSPISDWWHRVYMCILIHEGKFHLSPLSAVSIASKDFTRFQIVSWNPSMKLEINCAFIRSPLNCISNTDMLQNKFPVTILMLFKGWEFLTATYNAYFIEHSFSLHHPLHVSSHGPSRNYPVAFQGRCAQVFPDT